MADAIEACLRRGAEASGGRAPSVRGQTPRRSRGAETLAGKGEEIANLRRQVPYQEGVARAQQETAERA
eukprot:6636101-Alexandrium_andersonii.AAC.1